MAWIKDRTYVQSLPFLAFDELRKPGEKCNESGIYRCEGCRKEGSDVQCW
jgi:hypothetical protein